MTLTRPRSVVELAAGAFRVDKQRLFDDLGYEPHPGQREVHASSAPRRVLAAGVRFGKSRAAAMEGLAAALEPRKRSVGWITSVTYDLCDKVFRECAIAAAEHLRSRIVTLKENERKLVLRNLGGGLSEIRGKSADNPVSLLGEGLDWLVVDEAARMKRSIWEGHLSQRLLDKRGWALLISTPAGRGWFHDLWRRGQDADDPDHDSWQHPSWVNPYLDRSLIERERKRLPERVFAQEYEAKFIEGAGQVFRGVSECATGEFAEPIPGARYYAGLDLARVEDFSVLVVLDDDRRVVYFDRFNRIDWALQVQRVHASLERYDDAPVYVDSTGVGDPVFEALRRADVQALPYKFSSASKAALIDNVAMLIEQGQVTLPRREICPVLVDELESFQYSVSDSGNVKSGAVSGAHDDAVMALALAVWHQRPQAGRAGYFVIR